MKYKVLKPFDYAHDGVKPKKLAKDEVVDIRPHLVEGLTAGGFIEEHEEKPAKAEPKEPKEPKAPKAPAA